MEWLGKLVGAIVEGRPLVVVGSIDFATPKSLTYVVNVRLAAADSSLPAADCLLRSAEIDEVSESPPPKQTNRDRVVEAVRGGLHSPKEITQALGLAGSYIHKLLCEACERGAIERAGQGFYRVVSSAPPTSSA